MTHLASFPETLLTAPLDTRLHYFQHKVIAHPHLLAAHTALLQHLQYPAGAALIFVYGPTGVGKTTLRQRVEQQLAEPMLPRLHQDPERLPVVSLDVVAPESGNFNWKDYYLRALAVLEMPWWPVTGTPPAAARDTHAAPYTQLRRSHATAEFRRILEQGLRRRRPVAFMHDEAQHFKKVAGGRRLLDQMDTLKSLAEATQTVHVFLGTYELLALTDLSAQLTRRSLELHLPRYHWDDPQEWQIFQNILFTFQHHLPLAEMPDLVRHGEYLYEGCLGCVGILKTWLLRALTTALHAEAATLTRQDLEQHAEPARRLLRIAQEIKEGEAWLKANPTHRTDLRSLLGMEPGVPPASTGGASVVTAVPPSPRVPVGHRHPERDPIGELPHEQP